MLILLASVAAAHPLDRLMAGDDVVNCNELPIGNRCMASQIPEDFPDLQGCECPWNTRGES